LTEIETLTDHRRSTSALVTRKHATLLTWALGSFFADCPIGEQQIPSGATIKRQIKNRGKKSNAQATYY